MSRTHVVCLSFSPIRRDGRVLRQAAALAADHRVTVVGFGDAGDAGMDLGGGARFAPLPIPANGPAPHRGGTLRLLVLGRVWPSRAYPTWYWRHPHFEAAVPAVTGLRPDLIVANDWTALPVAFRAAEATGARVVADLHEFAPRQNEQHRFWRWFVGPAIRWLLERDLPRTAAVITVGEALAKAYAAEFGVRPSVVHNAPEAVPLPEPHATAADRVRVVCHGVAAPERAIERLIEVVALAEPRFVLDLMLVPTDRAYMTHLEALAARLAPDRIRFVPAVAPAQIVAALALYDVGLYVLPPSNFNTMYALPNKLFEFIAAGLAVCIGPSPAMAEIVERTRCGVVADAFTPERVVDSLNAMSAADIDRYKANARLAARSLNAAHEAATMRSVVATALATPVDAGGDRVGAAPGLGRR